jgi:hypothetical protein
MVSSAPPSRSSSAEDLLHAFSEDFVAVRPPTAPESEITIEVEGLGRGLKLAVDASPGCGGIAWPAGEVRCHSAKFIGDRKLIWHRP